MNPKVVTRSEGNPDPCPAFEVWKKLCTKNRAGHPWSSVLSAEAFKPRPGRPDTPKPGPDLAWDSIDSLGPLPENQIALGKLGGKQSFEHTAGAKA
jgi:hypothetical protein